MIVGLDLRMVQLLEPCARVKMQPAQSLQSSFEAARGLVEVLVNMTLKRVPYVSVECNLPYFSQWGVLVRPDFCQVEHAPAVVGSVCRIHDLDRNSPSGILATLNRFEQVFGVPIRIVR